eukprot:c11303_g1_i1.p1 GENE.c11303_g1_i1~~c11303_g1_i1.p1  ORF type:complete len:218 (+),score=19.00 c11303_g1_i1:425-1078(+)
MRPNAVGQGNLTYLEEFVKNLTDVPNELYRYFALIGELDVKCLGSSEEMDKQAKIHLARLKRLVREPSQVPLDVQEAQGSIDKIETHHKDCMRLSKEKIDLANRAYDLVDSHIRRLDDYLGRFEAELREQGKDPNKEVASKEGDDSARDMDMPIDPNEPTYCVCHRVSFGEMVACDNAECKVEWFHFECVGLKKQPKGRWFCPECADEQIKKKQKKM